MLELLMDTVSLQRYHTSSDWLSEGVTQGSRSIFAFQCQALSPACSRLLRFGGCFFLSVLPTQEPVTLVGRPKGCSKFAGFVAGCQDWLYGAQAEDDNTKGKVGTNLIQMLSFSAIRKWCSGRQYFTVSKLHQQWVSKILLNQLSMWVTVGFL